MPRANLQLGIFERLGGRLCGSGGLRRDGCADGTAVLGIELTPDDWGRYRLALEVVAALGNYGFGELGLTELNSKAAAARSSVER